MPRCRGDDGRVRRHGSEMFASPAVSLAETFFTCAEAESGPVAAALSSAVAFLSWL